MHSLSKWWNWAQKAIHQGHTSVEKRKSEDIRETCEKSNRKKYSSRLIWMTAEKNIIRFYHSNFCGFRDRNHVENWKEGKKESKINNFSKTNWEDTSRQFSDLSSWVMYNKNYSLFPNNVLEINYKINIFRI